MLNDNIRYIVSYEEAVPKLDLNKLGENGSPIWTWPVGGKSINYRWVDDNAGKKKILTLQGNPSIWLLGLSAILASVGLIVARIVGRIVFPPRLFRLTAVFTTLYFCYMAAMALVPRVLYLYHYFIPFLFSLVLFAVHLTALLEAHPGRRKIIYTTASVGAVMVLFCFLYFSPLSYSIPLSKTEFFQRAWLSLWSLSYPN